jgi:hypothetical protein
MNQIPLIRSEPAQLAKHFIICNSLQLFQLLRRLGITSGGLYS